MATGNLQALLAVILPLLERLAISAAMQFLTLPPAPSRRSSGWGWGQPAPYSPSANSPTVRTLSKMVKNPQRSSLQSPCALSLALSLSPHPANWHLPWLISWRTSHPVKRDVDRLSRHTMGLSEKRTSVFFLWSANLSYSTILLLSKSYLTRRAP